MTRRIRHYERVDNAPRAVACVYLAGLCANVFIFAHLLTHFASNLGVQRFLTSLLCSVCGLVIVNAEGLVLICNALFSYDAFYWLESSSGYQATNVVLQAATLFLLHFVCLISLLRLFCQPLLNRASRTFKIASGTSVALVCIAAIGVLAYSDCYYKFNTTLWSFAYKCTSADAFYRFLSLNFLTYEPPTLCATCVLLVYCGAVCSEQGLTFESQRGRARRNIRDSTILDVPGVSAMSVNESTPSRRRAAHEKKTVLVQTNILCLLLFLLVDSLVRLALPYQAQIATELFGSANSATRHNAPSHSDSTPAENTEPPDAGNFTFNNLNFVDRRVEILALALNCFHLTLIGVALPLCHFMANTRLRATFGALLKAAVRLLTCRRRDARSNGTGYIAR